MKIFVILLPHYSIKFHYLELLFYSANCVISHGLTKIIASSAQRSTELPIETHMSPTFHTSCLMFPPRSLGTHLHKGIAAYSWSSERSFSPTCSAIVWYPMLFFWIAGVAPQSQQQRSHCYTFHFIWTGPMTMNIIKYLPKRYRL